MASMVPAPASPGSADGAGADAPALKRSQRPSASWPCGAGDRGGRAGGVGDVGSRRATRGAGSDTGRSKGARPSRTGRSGPGPLRAPSAPTGRPPGRGSVPDRATGGSAGGDTSSLGSTTAPHLAAHSVAARRSATSAASSSCGGSTGREASVTAPPATASRGLGGVSPLHGWADRSRCSSRRRHAPPARRRDARPCSRPRTLGPRQMRRTRGSPRR